MLQVFCEWIIEYWSEVAIVAACLIGWLIISLYISYWYEKIKKDFGRRDDR
jgi:hypothetical protein